MSENEPFNFYTALKVAQAVFEQYQRDQPKWWRRMDGTPILNDIAVRMAEAFVDVESRAPRKSTADERAPEASVDQVIDPGYETFRCVGFEAYPDGTIGITLGVPGGTHVTIGTQYDIRRTPSTPPHLGPREPDDTMVICPACTCQFRAIPVSVQRQLASEKEARKPLRLALGGCAIEDIAGADNLAIALCTYFSDARDRPDDDEEGENGWGKWVTNKTNEALDALALAVCSAQSPEPADRVRALLESYFWLPGLKANERYSRLHDDHDGTYNGRVAVVIGEDGDAWLDPINPEGNGLRFRMPLSGGGTSQFTRTALVILAEAIRLDNERAPQARRPT